tara:strand:- start:276 stop:584 length:309 start_codon:yes stop_codon:yes gene_type:complete
VISLNDRIKSFWNAKGHHQSWLALQEVIEEVGYNQLPCAQAPDLYHPNSNEKHFLQTVTDACKQCPIIKPCGAYALKYEKEGIWGGMTASQRQKIRRAGKLS